VTSGWKKTYRKLFDPVPDAVVHMAAQGGLRKSMDEPATFISANISGFGHVIKATVDAGVGTMVYASSAPFTEAPDPAVQGGGPRRLAAIALRGDQTLRRTARLYLRPRRRPALHRPALFDRVRD